MIALKSVETVSLLERHVASTARPWRDTPSAMPALLLPAMYRIHCYLKTLAERLERDGAQPRITRPGLGGVGGERFQQTTHRYLAQGHPPSQVVFSCRLDPIEGAANPRRLQATLEFSADHHAGGLRLLVRNFDAPGVRRHFIWPQDVTPHWLDQMSRYVLREPHRFLVRDLPDQLRDALRTRLALDRQPPAGGGSPGLAAWIRQRLLGRVVTLRLQHRTENWTLRPLQGRFLLGRGSACQLLLSDPRVSRVHASIECLAGVWTLTDCSRNGTRVQLADGTGHDLHHAALPLAQPGFLTLSYAADDKLPVRVVFTL